MLAKAANLKEAFIHLRRTIHMHPELGFEETETSTLISQTLVEMGIETQVGVGKTGVVARLGNGKGPAIGIRADMDALPITELNDVPYKSQNPGVMHACGHDAHTAMLLGVAMLLKNEPINGEVRLIFQPSEEKGDASGVSGAPRMIKDGALKGLDAIIALHVDGTIDRGKIEIVPGYALANVDVIYAKIIGFGGHGATPDKTVDPIFIAGPVLNALHGIVSRRIDPAEPAVVTVGRIHGGTQSNIIPNEVELDITLRSLSQNVRQQLIAEVGNALSIARAMGGDYSMTVVKGLPAMYNDPGVLGWVEQTAAEMLGRENVVTGKFSLGAEDFAFMTQAVPGAMFFLGAKDPDGPARYGHHPEFDIDENALPVGAAILAQTALRFTRRDFA